MWTWWCSVVKRVWLISASEAFVFVQMDQWVIQGGTDLLPLEEEHCTVVEVTEEDIQNSVKFVPSLSAVVRILIIVVHAPSKQLFSLARRSSVTIHKYNVRLLKDGLFLYDYTNKDNHEICIRTHSNFSWCQEVLVSDSILWYPITSCTP